ncbi:MAG: hypothetical protein FWD84_00150 [Oscillospiraceae bacterium]|nr:hypothetical protein [Oscillospiraceae bacterium]
MAVREPGRFRRNLFGGFNRKDVLSYIKLIFDELNQAQAEAEFLRQRCIELENLIQNLEKAAAWSAPAAQAPAESPQIYQATPIPIPTPAPIVPVEAPQLYQVAPQPAPAATAEIPQMYQVAPTFTLDSDPAPIPAPVPAPAPTITHAPEWTQNPLYDPELISVLTSEPLPAEAEDEEFELELPAPTEIVAEAPAPTPVQTPAPNPKIKHSLTIPPAKGPTKVKVQRM